MSDGSSPVLAAELIRWSWVGDHLDDIRDDLLQHIQLTGLAVLFGLLLAFPLSLAAIRWPRLYGPILGFTGVRSLTRLTLTPWGREGNSNMQIPRRSR